MSLFSSSKISRLLKKIESLYQARLNAEVSDSQLAKEITYYQKLADIYDSNQYNKAYPYAKELAIESHRAAAELGDAHSQYVVGQRLLEQGKFWASIKEAFYQNQATKDYAKNAFSEAFKFLKSAHEQDNFLATRLLGVSYVNGWGVDMDVDKGAKLLVESIDKEGSWDKVSTIFSELGLNNPEFFSKFMSIKSGQ